MADYGYVTTSGVIVPDTATIKSDVVAEWRALPGLGGDDLSDNPETPQGAQMVSETLAREKMVTNNAVVANQINPNESGGVFLLALCALTGLEPEAGTHSVVPGVQLAGVATRIIPTGSQASAGGALFQSVADVTLDDSGLAVVDFQAVEIGAVPCAAHALTTIVTPVLGWETIDNPTAATLGTDELSDEALRTLRAETLGLQGTSSDAAVMSGVRAVPGVRSLQYRTNQAPTEQIIDGITLAPKSVWACVDGGTDADVAAALLENKSDGAAWNGATDVTIVEPASGQSYTVSFDRPDDVPMQVRATVKSSTSSTDPTLAVKNAVLLYAAGGISGMDGFKVGLSVSPFEISGAITGQVSGLYVKKLEVKKVTDVAWVAVEIALALNEQASIAAAHITVDLVT